MDVDELSHKFYEAPVTVADYSRHNRLWREEEIIFNEYRADIADKTVLDVGCGGGRTTPALAATAADYTGLDYSSAMITACRQKYHSLEFVHGDASDMRMFDDACFDFVLFSFNGIDCMSHEKRLRTIGEIFRILKPKGVYAFASHSRDDKRRVTAFNLRDLSLQNNLRNIRSYFAVKKHQVRTPAFAILSDPLVGYGQLTYYIRPPDQLQQLEAIGFHEVAILSQACQWVQASTRDRNSSWFHYVARKPGPP